MLFSAAYLQYSALRRLWRLKGVELLSSSYAVEEARRNLSEDRPEALGRLDELVKSMKLVEEAQDQDLPDSVRRQGQADPARGYQRRLGPFADRGQAAFWASLRQNSEGGFDRASG